MSVTLASSVSGIDPERWPDVAVVPRASRVRTLTTELVVRRAVAGLPIRLRSPDGRATGLGGPLLEIRDPEKFYRRLGKRGLVGFGESYLAGEWEAPDLVAVLTVLAAQLDTLVPASLQRLRRLWALRQPKGQRNTPQGARQNVHQHYDLSNELFALFLDETMSYSSGVFRSLPSSQGYLAAAQHRKIDRLLDLAQVRAGSRVLEIGTGWGELAIRAAARGAKVTSVTLSEQQRELALQRVAAADLTGAVTVELRDYRELSGEYDAVLSVEMIEAVGAEFWPAYFQKLDELLAPGGRIALQAITMPHDRMLASQHTHTWIQKYVFPGGMLPSTEAVHQHLPAGLVVSRRDSFGPHYAQTLRLWRERFAARSEEVGELGFDETFQRMWDFYLAYCEAGFRSGYLDVQQFLLTGRPTHAEADDTDGTDGPADPAEVWSSPERSTNQPQESSS